MNDALPLCGVCQKEHLSPWWSFVQWCDSCLREWREGGEEGLEAMDAFIARKREEVDAK